ncbi:hypothetical protein ACE6H2_020168 [Prunus campanulata]
MGSMDFEDWLLLNLQSKNKYAMDWATATRPSSSTCIRTVTHLHWQAPLLGTCKVNTDGGRNNTTGMIGAGGLLRDADGAWLKGFTGNLGVGSILEAELWGIFWGLSLAWDAGVRDVVIECDSSIAVDLINNPTGANHPLYNIINCCKLKIHGDWNCVVQHIYREMNTAADALAAMCADLAPGI